MCMKPTHIRRHLPQLIGFLFLYAGVHKLFWPGQATLALETLGFSKGLAGATVALVLIAEIYLGTLLLTGIDSRYAMGASIALMLIFTGYMFYLSVIAHPPSCGCLGLTGIFNSSKHEAIFGLLRNCIILWLLKLSLGAQPDEAKGIRLRPASS